MNCPQNSKEREIVIDYCAGTLDATRTEELERHLEQCAGCVEAIVEQRKVWEALDHWNAPAVSGDFNARLYACMASEDTAPAWRRWLRRIAPPASPIGFWKPAVSLAAACAVLAIGLTVHFPRPEATNAGTGLASVPAQEVVMQPAQALTHPAQAGSHVDIEQVANALDELDVLAPVTI